MIFVCVPAFVRVVALWLLLASIIQASHLKIVYLQAKHGGGGHSVVLVPTNPDVIKMLCLGYDQLVADLWWLGFIQYYGDTESRIKDHYGQSYAFLNLITQLDPRFLQPYWFAAFAVGSEQARPDLASGLIERGLEINQDSWYLPFIAGINQYLFAHNEVAAAKYYRMAAKYPDAPGWLNRQAGILESGVPSLLKEINTWATIYQSSAEKLVRATAQENLVRLWLRVYREVPSAEAKTRAKAELKLLGVTVR